MHTILLAICVDCFKIVGLYLKQSLNHQKTNLFLTVVIVKD